MLFVWVLLWVSAKSKKKQIRISFLILLVLKEIILYLYKYNYIINYIHSSYFTGPALSGSLVQSLGFKTMMIGIGIISFFYGPLLVFLKDPPPRTEQEKQETTVRKNNLHI